ncbi:hypothetical protein LFL96_25930 [Paraburkholderia sp. D15]|uniref:hypothetical protein n=1 Tax=Paraburkholderia sp. D15 TaxID=2880218 RepID=UPI002479DA8C|nr:hypothetical protein [Paraburkholderia sp. D15]WGS54456.1 hypothetical protein LFL96_25930 [Paraburkholderia sp. D15]
MNDRQELDIQFFKTPKIIDSDENFDLWNSTKRQEPAVAPQENATKNKRGPIANIGLKIWILFNMAFMLRLAIGVFLIEYHAFIDFHAAIDKASLNNYVFAVDYSYSNLIQQMKNLGEFMISMFSFLPKNMQNFCCLLYLAQLPPSMYFVDKYKTPEEVSEHESR